MLTGDGSFCVIHATLIMYSQSSHRERKRKSTAAHCKAFQVVVVEVLCPSPLFVSFTLRKFCLACLYALTGGGRFFYYTL